MTFADDGRGFSPQQDWRIADTLGLQLVRMLTDQLQGTIEMANGQGTTFQLSFSHSRRAGGCPFQKMKHHPIREKA